MTMATADAACGAYPAVKITTCPAPSTACVTLVPSMSLCVSLPHGTVRVTPGGDHLC
jgi:hypothetical protein